MEASAEKMSTLHKYMGL